MASYDQVVGIWNPPLPEAFCQSFFLTSKNAQKSPRKILTYKILTYRTFIAESKFGCAKSRP